MKRKKRLLRTIIFLLALLAGSINSLAQKPVGSLTQKPLSSNDKAKPNAPVPGKPPLPPKSPAHEDQADGTFKLLQPQFAFGTVVKGAPYSATAVTETVQTLGDGNQIIQKIEVVTYRDREGRTRHEQTLKTVGKWVSTGVPLRIVFVNDPVAGFSYVLNPHTQTALRRGYVRGKGPLGSGQPTAISSPDGRKQIEALGRRMVEGVEAEGTRSIVITPAGEIGNRLPIEVTDERWYSPELQMLVLRERHDPRNGDTFYRMININRSEPDRSLFEVPTDYTLKDETKPAMQPSKKPKTGKESEKKQVEWNHGCIAGIT